MVKEIEIGKNTYLITEVLDFLSSGKLLKPSDYTEKQDSIIYDLEIAKKFAWEEFYGEDELTWADLRAEKMSEIWDIIYENDEYSEIERKLTACLNDISDIIQHQLEQQYLELLDDIVSDMQACLLSRAVQGQGNKFFENIFLIYLNGGWPCGWKGSWPKGDILIYNHSYLKD
ncbi:hypothetical protein [Photobacterium damselae]|uniref:hypothetical protein n=1 Tax=Photobacterium damselae TaxID=38293 RepID=UPI0040687E51